MLFHKQKMNKLIRKTLEAMTLSVQKNVPQQGAFRQVGVRYQYPGNRFKGMLYVEEDRLQAGSCRLVAAMYRIGEDRQVSNYLMKGTKEEILDYLKAEKTVSELIGVFAHLKKKVEGLD